MKLTKKRLPILIGNKRMKEFNLNTQTNKLSNDYNPDVNPSIAAEFATAAYRFGHSLIRSFITKRDRELQQTGNITLTSVFLRPRQAYVDGGIDSLCRGMVSDLGTKSDPHLTEEVQNHLFESHAFGVQTKRFSLSAINIMRGRDHGIAPYNQFRKLAGLKEAANFDELKEIPDGLRQDLQKLYNNVNDIDAFTG
jgi:peroxidase